MIFSVKRLRDFLCEEVFFVKEKKSFRGKTVFWCHVSCVMFHMLGVRCPVPYIFFCWKKLWNYLVEGLLSTGPTLSSFF